MEEWQNGSIIVRSPTPNLHNKIEKLKDKMSENWMMLHAVCIPYPAQGHINPMLKLAKLLHTRGFYITFVNTEFNHRRLLKSRGPQSLPTFQFETIPDGFPDSKNIDDATQDIPSICKSTTNTCLGPFKDLLSRLTAPPVTCIVSDGVMSFTLDAAQELGIPQILFWTISASGFLGYLQYNYLRDKGYTPLKDESYFGNGYLKTVIDGIPEGGMEGIRLKDFPSFIRTTDPNEFMVHFLVNETNRAKRASAIILNTFDKLESDVLSSISNILPPPIYTVGPLNLRMKELENVDNGLKSLDSNLWKEETECLEWLDLIKESNSVVYVNFGSITVMTTHHLVEFAWGLANSEKPFLWIIRPDIVAGDMAILPVEFVEETKDRGMIASWCPQEKVLAHRAIGGFLTHSGWNSTMESISYGVPMICWPFFAEQPTNCWYCSEKWGIAKEIDSDVKRADVERLVRELMDGDGEEGKKMRVKAMEWKKKAEEAVGTDGSSYGNLDKLIHQVLLPTL